MKKECSILLAVLIPVNTCSTTPTTAGKREAAITSHVVARCG
jgi:hypothetical protein